MRRSRWSLHHSRSRQKPSPTRISLHAPPAPVLTTVLCVGCTHSRSSILHPILEKGSFAGSAGPLKLAGQLQFSLSWCARRLGRAATQPIHRAGHALGRNEKLDKVTEEALKFLRDLLVDPASGEPRLWPRVFTYGHAREPHAIVWSDACWEDKVDKPAGIGFVVFIPASPTDEAAAASLSPSEASTAAASHSLSCSQL